MAGQLLKKKPGCIVVIPAFSEYDFLFDTLFSLSASATETLQKTQVIVVINNRISSTPEDIKNNTITLSLLESLIASDCYTPLSIAWIDACTAGNAFSDREGVGLARRIGADHALHLLARHSAYDVPIVHLDADTVPAPGYLDAVVRFYASTVRWGGYAAYQHPTDDNDLELRGAMIAYENYMRYHELGLRFAGSPYAYPALGSIMSSTAYAYAAVGGMNRRCAGEDFYFMQQLRKTGSLSRIPAALVYPAGRSSVRTPFGTGRSISTSKTAPLPHAFLYHPECYQILRELLQLIKDSTTMNGKQLLDAAVIIHPELKRFLAQKRFRTHWDRITANHPASEARQAQFHVWFDGLRTIQLIHHLRNTSLPDIPATEAIQCVFSWYATSLKTAEPLKCLRELRRLCRQTCAD